MMLPILFRLMGLAGFPLIASCSGGYQADFRQAVANQPAAPADPTGPWKGEWKSEVNGHHGPLWCIIQPGGEARHEFRYRAGWGALQFGDYTHRTSTTMNQGTLSFSGEMDLPGGAGVYEVKGTVTAEAFEARYESKGDRGTMRMTRP